MKRIEFVYQNFFIKTFKKNEKKHTEKSWGHTYKSAYISVGICLRRLNLVQNQRQDRSF